MYRQVALFKYPGAIWKVGPSLFTQWRNSHLHARPVPGAPATPKIDRGGSWASLAPVFHICPQPMMLKGFGYNILVKVVQ